MIEKYLLWALPVLLTALIGSISYRIHKDKERFNNAADTFRSSILFALKGIYPINQYLDASDFHRIYQSIPNIMSAAAEFRIFVKSKDAFDCAVKEYDEYCRKTTYDNVIADSMWPSMRKSGEIEKREQFKNIVEYLISFANEK